MYIMVFMYVYNGVYVLHIPYIHVFMYVRFSVQKGAAKGANDGVYVCMYVYNSVSLCI